jgi:hypothetical protein
MKSHFMRRLAVGVAALATLVGMVGMPATQAQAQPQQDAPRPCPRILAVCAYDVNGDLRLLFEPEVFIDPPLEWAQNNTPDTWCFYAEPGGQRTVARLGSGQHQQFNPPVYSARPVPPGEQC